MKYLHFLALTLILVACKTYSDEDLKNFDKQIQEFMTKKGLKMDASPSGLYYKINPLGEGRNVLYQDSIVVTYEGKLLNGEIFDRQKDPITFALKDMIGGWKEALLMMKKGDEIELLIPPQLGYGEHKLDDIPQHSILFFNIKLLDLK
jgi:FKBP-type peptidyl-prolyl cis-trans isomerase FkpA